MNSLITTVPSLLTSTSNNVPLTEAVVVLPTTWKEAPPTSFCTELSVRPSLSVTEMSCTCPSLAKCDEVIDICVLLARRVMVPSGNWIWPRPAASVLTESPG